MIRRLASRRYLGTWIILALGSAASLLSGRLLSQQARRLAEQDLERAAADRLFLTARTLQTELSSVASLAALFQSSVSVEPGEFRRFTRHLLSLSAGGAVFLAWSPRLPADRLGSTGDVALQHAADTLTELASDGRIVPAVRRAEHYPVAYIEPRRGDEWPLGLDISSDPGWWGAASAASETGQLHVSRPDRSPGGRAGRRLTYAVAPVFDRGELAQTPDERRARLRGFVWGAFLIGRAVDDQVAPEAFDVDVRLLDDARGPPPEAAAPVVATQAARGPRLSRSFSFGGKRFLLEARPAAATGQEPSRRPWLVLGGGLVLTLLLGFVSVASVERAEARHLEEELRRRVDERTADVRLRDRAIEAVGSGVVITDAQSGDDPIVFVNPAFERITGYSASEALGRNCRFLQGEDRDQPGLTVLRRALERGIDVQVLLRNYRKDGSRFWNQFAVSPLKDTEGRVTHHVGILTDVTQRRRLEASMRYYFEQSSDLFCVAGFDGYFKELSSAWERVLGHDREELLSRPFVDLVHPDDREPTATEAARLAEGTETVAFVNRYRTRDGEYRWFLWNASGVPAEGVIYATARDITEAKEHEAELEERAEQLRLLTDALPIAIWYAEADRRLRFANETLCSWHGLSREQAVGRKLREIVGEGSFTAIASAVDEAVAGRPASFEAQIGFPDGATREVQGSLVPSDGEAGGPSGYFGMMSDLTELKLTQRQFLQAQKMEAVGRLTGGIAHDFNNLLGIVVGGLELSLRRVSESDRVHKLLSSALAAARRGTELTRDLLTFSRTQTDNPIATDLNETIGRFEKMLRRTLGEAVGLKLELCSGPASIVVDVAQLETAILNLTINARDAMSEGGVLRIETGTFDAADIAETGGRGPIGPGPFVRLAVMDDGEGMSPEVRERIFEPFYTTKGAGRGTGLGLAMVQGFVERSNGHIYVDSEPGKGTTFSIYLPRAGDAPGFADAKPAAEAEALPHGHERILLAEDDEALREVTRTLLEESGYEVIEAADGPSALEQLERHGDTALLITDVVMPGGLSGDELVKRARTMRPRLQVLFVSGYPREDAGADDGVEWLTKPYSQRTLVETVRRLLDETVMGSGHGVRS